MEEGGDEEAAVQDQAGGEEFAAGSAARESVIIGLATRFEMIRGCSLRDFLFVGRRGVS